MIKVYYLHRDYCLLLADQGNTNEWNSDVVAGYMAEQQTRGFDLHQLKRDYDLKMLRRKKIFS